MRVAKSLFFFLLMPVYLGLVYYKTVYESDIEGLLALSVIMLLVYLPFASLLAQENAELSIYSLLENEEANRYLNLLFLFVGMFVLLAGVIFALTFFHMGHLIANMGMFNIGIALTIYAVWVLLTHRLFLIWLESDLINFLKMGFMLFLIIGLFIAHDISNIHQEVGFTYMVTLAWTVVKDIFFLIILMPAFFSYMLGFVGDSKKESIGGISLLPLLFTLPGFLFAYIVFVLFIDWASGFINSFNSYQAALALSVSMIVISALGTYFQLRVFMGTFFKQNVQKLSYVFLGIFYATMMIHMNLVDSIDKTASSISHMQWEAKHVNKKLQNFMNSKI
ncbi:hypothetical protein LCX93_10925 [Sulfurimonas sp. SWIR-19]|uniref:hypothetical protein n=1 Tax=Sulfurimonas sp. SWIR-19 TaxID=2878390 RepID=UPI001CF21B22|nr:hypothetical protein [Sulfurimonas sp. SWIR-19]UCN00027.1 hypothetical protein LCX93_10925 [Sulfurimonas sp. SWIR-19]